jgi:hypothetical protein
MSSRFPESGDAAPSELLPVEYVDRHLYDEGGQRVVAKLLDDRLQVSRMYPEAVQRRAIDDALSLSAHH